MVESRKTFRSSPSGAGRLDSLCNLAEPRMAQGRRLRPSMDDKIAVVDFGLLSGRTAEHRAIKNSLDYRLKAIV